MLLKWLLKPELTTLGRFANITIGFVICLVWVALISIFYRSLPPLYIPLPLSVFIFSCLIAPLWEELAFRHIPMSLAREFGERTIIPIMCLSSIVFGLMHNQGIHSLLVQGVMGFIMALVYIKNGFHYWSSVFLHFLWNFFVIFIIRIYS